MSYVCMSFISVCVCVCGCADRAAEGAVVSAGEQQEGTGRGARGSQSQTRDPEEGGERV